MSAKKDTNRIKLLVELGDELHDREARAALDYGLEARRLADSLGWHPLTGRIEELIGYTNNEPPTTGKRSST
ncbi:MAG: hypothetical protein IPH53_00035 [Flavobacteriales bacterium]|nr:hypothetical protein [Flavobacteriales bacterium]